MDLLAALVKKSGVSGLSSIFSIIHSWFLTGEETLQKKAFRILEEITKRMSDKSVEDFFASSADEISNVLDQVGNMLL